MTGGWHSVATDAVQSWLLQPSFLLLDRLIEHMKGCHNTMNGVYVWQEGAIRFVPMLYSPRLGTLHPYVSTRTTMILRPYSTC